MKGWVLPAEKLMGNMRFPAKFTLVSILFLIPLVLTLVLYWQESSKNINLLQRETQGMKFIERLQPVLIESGKHRGLTHALLNGDQSVRGQLSQQRSVLSQEINALRDAASGEVPHEVKQGVERVGNQWQKIVQMSGGGRDAQALFKQHNLLAIEIRDLFITTSQSYALELDSDAQTTFLINLVVSTLPELVDESGRLRDAATGVAAMGRFTPDSFIYLSNQLNKVAEEAPVLQRSANRPLSFDGGQKLQQEISQAARDLSSFQEFIRTRVVEPDNLQIDANSVFIQSTGFLKTNVKLYDHLMPTLHMLIEERLSRRELHRNLILVVILLAIGTAVYLFAGFYCYTIGTVNRFSEMAALLAAGDLGVRLERNGCDEMAGVSDGFNQVAEGFQNLVRQAVSSTVLVAESARSMTQESDQTLQGAAEQKREAEQIASAVQDLADSALDISRNSAEAAESAQRADEMATQGREMVEHTARSFNGMLDEVARTSDVIGQLDTDVQAIGDISGVIREIAEQTNLLALNAAIEAARAGEQGRGFAVVADEVRNLAQRTQASTLEIQQTIESLQACTKDSVELMTSSHQQVSANVEEINKAGELLGAIDDVVAEMNHKNAEIASAVQAQNSLVDNLRVNIDSISSVADGTESSAQQSAKLAQDMSGSSARLSDTLAAFRIG